MQKSVKTQSKGLTPAQQARLESCAYIFLADKADKIQTIAAKLGITEMEAARKYAGAAAKRCITWGSARNYTEALDLLEMEQGGDTSNPLLRTMSAAITAERIAELTRMTNSGDTLVNVVDVIRRAWANGDNQLLTEYAQAGNWRIMETAKAGAKRQRRPRGHTVLGTMYTEYEFRLAQTDHANSVCNKVSGKHVGLYLKEYISRLSPRVQKNIDVLVGHIESVLKTMTMTDDETESGMITRAVQTLTSAQARKDTETKQTAEMIYNLHRGFEHNEAVTAPELAGLVYQHKKDML